MRGPESDYPGQAHYHYNREEREAGLSDAVRNRRNGSFWRRNRHLLMILIDILVVCAVFLFLLPNLRSGGAEIEGYRFDLKVVLFDDTLLCSLRVDGADATGEREVRVLLRALPGGKSVELFDLLTPGDETILRARLPFSGTERDVAAVIELGGETATLERGVPEE